MPGFSSPKGEPKPGILVSFEDTPATLPSIRFLKNFGRKHLGHLPCMPPNCQNHRSSSEQIARAVVFVCRLLPAAEA